MTMTKSGILPSLEGKWKTYPAYKDSGVELLEKIPEHWDVKKVKWITSSHKQGYYTEHPYVDNGIRLVRITDIDDFASVSFECAPYVQIAPENVSAFEVKDGDFLFARSGTIGRFGIVRNPEPAVFASYLIRFRFDNMDKNFLRFAFISHFFRESLLNTLHGGANQNIHAENIKEQMLFCPPLPEQQTIALFLDRETAKINALIAKKERLIELLQEKRAALISQAVTKGLDPMVPMKDSGVEWLGEIPAHWEVKRLKFAARLETGHTPNRSIAEYWENCTIPWVTLNDVGYLKDHEHIFETTNYINSLGIANSSARLLPAETVILSRDATVGRCGILGRPMATSQHFVDWICHEELLPKYLLLVFRGPMQQEFERLTMGATLRTIGMPDVNSFCVPLPPISDQKEIVLYIEDETTKIDALISRIREGIEKLKEYSTALISAAVTGKIDVRGEIVPSYGTGL